MKKLKIGFGEGGFQGFLARHVEKCVLMVVILLMAYFIYSGSNASWLEGNSLTKEEMASKASEADKKITDAKFEVVKNERDPKKDVARLVETQTARVDSRPYGGRIWDMPLVPRLQPRRDPTLFAPESLVVTPLVGPLAVMDPESAGEGTGAGYSGSPDSMDTSKDPLLKFDVILGGSGGGLGSGYGGMEGAGYGPPSGESTTKGKSTTTKSSRPKRPSRGEGPGSEGGYPGGYPGETQKSRRGRKDKDSEESGYPSSSMEYSGTGTKQQRMVSPEATLGVKAQGATIEPRVAMVINATVPYEKQWNAYGDAFREAPGGQDPQRDIPLYLRVWVQRTDVTDDPDVAPDAIPEKAWAVLSNAKLIAIEDTYAAEVPEISDPEALDYAIAHPVPPFLMTNLLPAMTHPDIPRATEVSLLDEETGEEMENPEMNPEGFEIPLEALEGSGGASGEYGAGMPSSRGPSSRGPRTRRSSRGSSAMGYEGSGTRGRRSGPMMGSGAYGGAYGGSSSVDMETYRPVAKKQVRFVDFDVQPGRKYRYRMQLVLNDPNHPADRKLEPEMTSLDDKARERVKAIEARDEKAGKGTRTFWITTPWSKPSDVVGVPRTERYYAGSASRPGMMKINEVDVSTTEPQAKVLTVQWDESLGIYAPLEQTVARGGVLNSKADVEFVHPIRGDLRKIPAYTVRTDGIVLDVFGGDNLPSNDKEPQKSPGETLIMDAEGNLIVSDEATGAEGYRKFIFPEPKEEPVKASAEGDESGPMGYPMGESGYPGSQKGRRPRGSRSSEP